MARSKTSKKSSTENSITPAETVSASLDGANGSRAASSSPADKKSRKPTVVKTGGQPSVVVPINLEDEIRKVAYLFAERRGFMPGHEADDWLAAEREVLQRYHQQTA